MDRTIGEAVERINDLTQAEFDQLAFGAIKVDASGVIVQYNAYEGRLTGRDPRQVVGRNFFTEVAPCTNVQEFAGRFREGMEARALNVTFPYRFLFPSNYIDVEITMLLTADGQGAWVLVKERQQTIAS